jgi:hypothetical protein
LARPNFDHSAAFQFDDPPPGLDNFQVEQSGLVRMKPHQIVAFLPQIFQSQLSVAQL